MVMVGASHTDWKHLINKPPHVSVRINILMKSKGRHVKTQSTTRPWSTGSKSVSAYKNIDKVNKITHQTRRRQTFFRFTTPLILFYLYELDEMAIKGISFSMTHKTHLHTLCVQMWFNVIKCDTIGVIMKRRRDLITIPSHWDCCPHHYRSVIQSRT